MTTTKVPWRNRFAFEIRADFRLDEGLFKWDSTFNEKTKYKHMHAIWWPRLYFKVMGFSFGVGLWLGRGSITQ